ncbi:MAG: hypothetical protein K8R23_17385 [Chthoniobacter sp.]|nr:hypothetical protein [Chthoniobacter sp.]
MTKEKTKAYCRKCRHEQLFVMRKMHHGLHFFFSLVTLGLWLVSWLALYVGLRLNPWSCQQCGDVNPIFPDKPDAPPRGEGQ